MDIHNKLKRPIWSPRMAVLYIPIDKLQFRLSYGTGFKAPQAFDTDLHIAFAGGGVSRVMLSPNLVPERSQSFSSSINYDFAKEDYIVGFTLEGFYTHLRNTFVLTNIGEDDLGKIFEKQNGNVATVQGITLELRGNYKKKIQLETGFTWQKSFYETPVVHIQGLSPVKEFVRTPNVYGFANLNLTPNKNWYANVNMVYIGSMIVPHNAGAINFLQDKYFNSPSFTEVNSKLGYNFISVLPNTDLEFYVGVKNMFNQYQKDFDIGKNRDSNYIYGTAQPRTVFIGFKIKS